MSYTNEDLTARVADETLPRHLREIADLMLTIPEEDRAAVSLGANRMVNLTGTRYSDAIRSEVRSYRDHRETWQARRERDRADDARVRELERAHIAAGLIDLDRIPR